MLAPSGAVGIHHSFEIRAEPPSVFSALKAPKYASPGQRPGFRGH